MIHSAKALASAGAGNGPARLGTWSCELATDAIGWAPEVFEIFGVDPGIQLHRRDMLDMYAPACRHALERQRSAAIQACSPFMVEASIIRPDRQLRWIRITAMPKVDRGRTVGLFGMKQDITAERTDWESLRRLAYYDPLTGLANRGHFQAGFLDLPHGAQSLVDVAALALFDLDGFKAINDRWGHLAGDACLVTFARRLQSRFPHADCIARIGGDEFAMVLPHGLARGAMLADLHRAIPALTGPVVWNDHILRMGASVGVAFTRDWPQACPEELFSLADADLYRFKARLR